MKISCEGKAKNSFDEDSFRRKFCSRKFRSTKILSVEISVSQKFRYRIRKFRNEKSSGEKSEGEIPSSRSLEDPTINRLPRQREINDWSGTIIWNVIVFHPPHVENFKDR